MMGRLGMTELLLIVVVLAVVLLPGALILRKAGYSPWAALVLLIPGAFPFVVLYLALAEWPIEREVRELRNQLGQ